MGLVAIFSKNSYKKRFNLKIFKKEFSIIKIVNGGKL